MRYISPYGMPEDSPWIDGDPTIARQGSIPPAAAFEHPLRELVGVVNKSGLVPSGTDLLQVAKGIRSQYMNFAEDTGSANNLSCAFDPPLLIYTNGLVLRVRVRVTNNGSSTIDAGAGRALIRRPDGLQLLEGDLPAGAIANLIFDGTTFQLMNAGGRAAQVTINELPLPYCVDTSNTPNIVVAPFLPEIVSEDLRPGLAVLVKIANTNFNATIIKVNNLVDIPVFACGHGPLYAYDIAEGDVKLFVFDGSVFWIEPSLQARKFGSVAGWVRTDGNDATGDGTSNTPEKAFRTIQRAYEVMGARYAPSPLFTIDLRLGIPGRYAGAVIGPYGGNVSITGDPSVTERKRYEIGPWTYPITNIPYWCLKCDDAHLYLNGVNLVADLSTAAPWNHLAVVNGGFCQPRDTQFEIRTPYLAGNYIGLFQGSSVVPLYSAITPTTESVTFQGNGNQLMWCIGANNATFAGGIPQLPYTVTCFYNTRFDAGWCSAWLGNMGAEASYIYQSGCSGPQYYCIGNSIINRSGQILPGDQLGTSLLGGIVTG